jgi:DnaJ-domain-containing protein 1
MSRELDRFYKELLMLHRQGAGAAVWGMLEAPGDLSGFLNRLARPAERLSEPAEQLGSNVDELSAAAYAFMRHRLFAPANHHYQVLGLPTDASGEDIRRRYRLLIGLFHPDRINRSEQWVDKAVRQLNSSYAELKRPERRRAYDASLQQADHGNRPRRPAARAQPAPRYRAPLSAAVRPTDALYRITPLQRNPRAFVWLVIISLLILVMLLVMNSSAPTSLTLTGAKAPETRLADQVPGNPVIARISSAVDAVPVEEAGLPLLPRRTASDSLSRGTPLAVGDEVKNTPPAATEEAENVLETGAVPGTPASPGSVAPRVLPAQSLPPVIVPPSAMPFDGARISPAGSLTGDFPAADGASAGDGGKENIQPEFVLMRYIRAWEKGDTEGLLRLFTLDAHANGRVGRKQIGQGYSHVFAATRDRRFSLEQLRIVPLGEKKYQAWAEISATADSVADGTGLRYRGEMAFDLVSKGRRLYIASLRHDIQAEEE